MAVAAHSQPSVRFALCKMNASHEKALCRFVISVSCDFFFSLFSIGIFY